jgi:hypothetical protein
MRLILVHTVARPLDLKCQRLGKLSQWVNGVEERIGACFSGGKRSFGHGAGAVFATSFGFQVLRLVLRTAFRFCRREREVGRRRSLG